MTDPKPTKDFSLFPSFADLPNPPTEEIVEPKSFRNTMIRTLAWMAFVPVFSLFFLLNHQIQSITKDADNVQLSIAQNIATTSSNWILSTVKMVQFSADLMSTEQLHDKQNLESVLQRLMSQNQDMVYGAWVDDVHKIVVSHSENKPAFPYLERDHQLLDALDKKSNYLSQISPDGQYVTVAIDAKPQDAADSIKFLAVMRLSSLKTMMEKATHEQRFSIALIEGKNRVVFNSDENPQVSILESTSTHTWNQIYSSPKGSVIRSPEVRNVAEVRSFVYIPGLDWVVAVSEPISQRDALIRSSMQTACFVLLATLAVSVFAGIFTAGPLSRSVNHLADAVRRFGRSGRLDQNLVNALEKEGTTELVALGKSFENMARDIQDSNAKLANLNTELEAQVLERTATVLLRNQELRALHRLLVPIQSSEDKAESELIKQSLEEFRLLLGLSELRFARNGQPPTTSDTTALTQRVPVTMNMRQFGWLEVGDNDLLTADRLESLQRLANSVSILLANKSLVIQLAKEHETLETVFESMTDGILIIGRSGRVIYANDLAAKLLNGTDLIVGVDAHRLVFDYWKPVNKPGEIGIQDLMEVTRFVPITSKNGKNEAIDIVAFKVSDLPGFSGERIGLLIRDMTHEAEIESMKDNLVSVVAHELKTPVTAIRLQAESLRHSREGNKDVDLCELNELIEESSRLGQLIDDLLDISRIEGGAMKLAQKVVQVASLIDRAAHLTLSRYAIRIERRIHPDAETFMADPERITQVFVNLFNNAARYKKDSQSVARCTVNVEPQDEFLRIEITDYGRGIPSDIIDNIFERFYQADMTDHRVSGGTGLGLSIVNGIVQAHGGTISVDSVLEEYTRFVILLPY